MKKKTILILLLLLFLSVFIFSGVSMLIELSQRERDDETFDELADLIEILDVSISDNSVAEHSKALDDTSEEGLSGEVSSPDATAYHKRNLAPIIEKNNDCIGWIYIKDTQVNYPVMYTPYEPQKYIDKSFDLKSSSYGVPFLEYLCTPYGDHVVIYGHNMKNGSMFATLKLYRNAEYFSSHPVIEFETVEGCKTYRVLAMCEISSSDKWYSFLDTSNEAEFKRQTERILKRAVNKADFTPEFGKQIITLSTCQGSNKDARLVLIAIEG